MRVFLRAAGGAAKRERCIQIPPPSLLPPFQDEFAALQDKYRRVKEQRIGEVEALLADHDRRVRV